MNPTALKGDLAHNWNVLKAILLQAGCDINALLNTLEVFEFEGIAKHRNALAHGEIVTQTVAQDLRAKIIGAGGQPGLLSWLALHLDPA